MRLEQGDFRVNDPHRPDASPGVADLVTHAFPLENFATALDTFGNRRDGAIKVVIEPN
jgi:L-iditol 2-dehydrogenase